MRFPTYFWFLLLILCLLRSCIGGSSFSLCVTVSHLLFVNSIMVFIQYIRGIKIPIDKSGELVSFELFCGVDLLWAWVSWKALHWRGLLSLSGCQEEVTKDANGTGLPWASAAGLSSAKTDQRNNCWKLLSSPKCEIFP